MADKEYIERDAAIHAIQNDVPIGQFMKRSTSTAIHAMGTVCATIHAIPAADVVEVVRCKECIYWRGENDLCKGICIDFDADGYCSEGKRKDGGQDE